MKSEKKGLTCDKGKSLKTHQGVQTEFLRLTKDDSRFSLQLRGFLSQAYNLKAIAGYETGPGAEISPARARAAGETGKQFVAHIAGLLSTPSPSPGSKPSVCP